MPIGSNGISDTDKTLKMSEIAVIFILRLLFKTHFKPSLIQCFVG